MEVEEEDPHNSFGFIVNWIYAKPSSFEIEPCFGITNSTSAWLLADWLGTQSLQDKLILHLHTLFDPYSPFHNMLNFPGDILNNAVAHSKLKDALIYLVNEYCHRFPSDRNRVFNSIGNFNFSQNMLQDQRFHQVIILRTFYDPSLNAVSGFGASLVDQMFEHHPLFWARKPSESPYDIPSAPSAYGLCHFCPEGVTIRIGTTDAEVKFLRGLLKTFRRAFEAVETDHHDMGPKSTKLEFSKYFDFTRKWIRAHVRSRYGIGDATHDPYFDVYCVKIPATDYGGMVHQTYSYIMFFNFFKSQALINSTPINDARGSAWVSLIEDASASFESELHDFFLDRKERHTSYSAT